MLTDTQCHIAITPYVRPLFIGFTADNDVHFGVDNLSYLFWQNFFRIAVLQVDDSVIHLGVYRPRRDGSVGIVTSKVV
ncbi:Uncharacterised protein [Serratia fonticola]|nr:Uncharacterised protein [Serratia fonticola]